MRVWPGAALIGVMVAAGGAGWGAEPAEAKKAPEAARIAAVRKVVMAREPKNAAAFRAGLKDESAMLRRMSIYGLERLRDTSASAEITALLKDADPWVRRTAAVALSKMGAKDAGAALVAAAGKDADILVRYEALVALARLQDAGVQAGFFAAVQDMRLWRELWPQEQGHLAQLITEPWVTAPGVQEFLRTILKNTPDTGPTYDKMEPARRESAVRSVKEAVATALAMRFGDASGEDLLIAAVTRRDDDFLYQKATRALAAIRSKKAVPALIAALDGNANKEKWPNNLRYAIEAMGAIGDAQAVPALEKLLTHEDYRMRRTAAEALFKIDGRKRDVAPDAPAAKVPAPPDGRLPTPGGRMPPQFILLGVDDCTNMEGLEAMADICDELKAKGSKAVFTMWLAPLAGSSGHNDIEKRQVLYQHLFDMGCEIAHHTLHHNPGGRNWASLPREQQIEEIEGATKWYQENIEGFTRPFTFKGGGGGRGSAAEREFSNQLIERQNFIYRGRRGGHPNEFVWPEAKTVPMTIPGTALDSNAPPVHEKITDGIVSDYPGRFDFEVDEGVAMWKANLEYRHAHPVRPPLVVNAFHDWALRDAADKPDHHSIRNEGKILKAFLLDVLVKNKEKYPDTYCVTFRQFMEYVRTEGDLKQTLDIGNGQDKRSKVVPSIQ